MAASLTDGRRLDPHAVRTALARLRRNPQAPWLHTEVARRMVEKLGLIRARPEELIDWWSALGGGAAALTKALPEARQLRVEPDDRWAEQSRAAARVPWWRASRWSGPVVEVVTETAEIAPGAGMVWANMMLHAVVDPVPLIERWHRLLKVDGFVMFSCLGPGTLRELRELYARRGWPTPTPGFIDMHDLGDMLVGADFADPVMDQETLTLRWSSPAAALAELRTLGANAAPERFAGWRTPRWRAALEAALASIAAPDGSIALSFEVAYGHAFKAAPRGAGATVSLDEMRRLVRTAGSATPLR